MLLVALLELVPGVGVALAADVLERVGSRDAADARTDVVREAERHALDEAGAIRVADAGRVDEPMRRHRRDVGAPAVRSRHRRSMLAARDDERFHLTEKLPFAHRGFLAQQL